MKLKLYFKSNIKMDFTNFDDGIFCIDEINGFLPKKDPLEILPLEFI